MTLPAIRRQVVVAAEPEVAYRAWVDDFGAWWPLERHSVFGASSTVTFEGREIVETSPAGERSVWGTVTLDEPPHRIGFTWHPGRTSDDLGTVMVAFLPIADGLTLVSLEHRGWEHYEDADEARTEYRHGWPLVLTRIAEHLDDGVVDESAQRDDPVWLVLDHTLGGAAEGVVFGHPLFAAHREFLETARRDGVLVAAGPLPDDPGHGQTVLRVPARDAARWVAAAEADGSVAGDLFVLRVRPWLVQLTGD